MKPISLAILWHMHQPMYRLRDHPTCFMPWVRLHAVRAYYDMIRVLDEFPQVRVTMNLVPAMVEQLLAYAEGAGDLFLGIGSLEPEQLGEVERAFLFDHFFSAQPDRMIRPIPHYGELLRRRNQARVTCRAGDAWKEFSTSDYLDLIALFNLAWFGFKAREDFPQLNSMLKKGGGFTVEEIREIHAIQLEIIRKLIPLYREKLAQKRIEISTSPYAHPILPLLLNTESTREAMPKHPLPALFKYPQDARRQVEEGLDLIERTFGVRPTGLWPSEGSVSQETVELLAFLGLRWAATDEGILHRSEREAPPNHHRLWEAFTPSGTIAMIFRDRELSDRIGFAYQNRDPHEAAKDFIATLFSKFQTEPQEKAFALVALDGENPWEHYPAAGALFLRALYAEIQKHREITPVTVSDLLAPSVPRSRIKRIHAGSWINADFGIWIGGPEKNRAWSILERVRSELSPDLDASEGSDPRREAAWKSIRAAEGSDWFWWLDGQFTSSYREQFDETFRNHLRQAYEALGLAAPNFLLWFIPSTRVRTEGVQGEPFEWLAPVLDGFESGLFEWHGSIRLSWKALRTGSTLYRGDKPLDAVQIGFSRDQKLMIRIDPGDSPAGNPFADMKVELSFKCEDRVRRIRIRLDPAGNPSKVGWCDCLPENLCLLDETYGPSQTQAIARKILEIAVSCEEAGLRPDQPAVMIMNLQSPAVEIQLREIRLRMPSDRSMIDSAGVE